MKNIIKILKQFICKHRNIVEYTKDEKILNLQGERRYVKCKECGKELYSYFAKYEGRGFK